MESFCIASSPWLAPFSIPSLNSRTCSAKRNHASQNDISSLTVIWYLVRMRWCELRRSLLWKMVTFDILLVAVHVCVASRSENQPSKFNLGQGLSIANITAWIEGQNWKHILRVFFGCQSPPLYLENILEDRLQPPNHHISHGRNARWLAHFRTSSPLFCCTLFYGNFRSTEIIQANVVVLPHNCV